MISLISGALPPMEMRASSVRITSLYEAYGCKYDFLRFFIQRNDEDSITAILSLIDGNATLYCRADADTDELVGFARAIGAETIYSELPLPLAKAEHGVILKKQSVGNKTGTDQIDLKALYAILSDAFVMPEFSAWYPDISHRIRHGCACAVLDCCGGAVMLLSSIGAMICGIAVKDELRGNGNGSKLLNTIEQYAHNCDIFALAEEQVAGFYEKKGYVRTGIFSTYKVK